MQSMKKYVVLLLLALLCCTQVQSEGSGNPCHTYYTQYSNSTIDVELEKGKKGHLMRKVLFARIVSFLHPWSTMSV